MKKIIVLLMALLPIGLVAQELKIAYVNTGEIFNVMPEVASYETEMSKFKEQYQAQFKIMEDEYNKKYQDYLAKQDSLPENIKMMLVQEITTLSERIEGLQQMFTQEQEKKHIALFTPIQEKLQKAIDAVGEENGLTFIFSLNPQVILYKSKAAIDATGLVKAKLGIK